MTCEMYMEKDVQFKSHLCRYSLLKIWDVFFCRGVLICILVLHVFTQFLENYSSVTHASDNIWLEAAIQCMNLYPPFIYRASV